MHGRPFMLKVVYLAYLACLGLPAVPAIEAVVSVPAVTVEQGGRVVLPCHYSESAVCMVSNPQGWFMTAFIDGKPRNTTAVKYNETHCACLLPPADAEAPVTVSLLNVNGGTAQIEYVALWTTSLSRRPYLSSDAHAGVVLSVHPSLTNPVVSVELQGGHVLLQASPVPSGAASVLAFPLRDVAPVVDVQVVVKLVCQGGYYLERRLLLSRVSAPPNTLGSFVQVDYTRKALLVNGAPLLGVGYYDSSSNSRANLSRQAEVGINWGMRYLINNDKLPRLPDSFIQDYLDWSHSLNMYVMFDIYRWIQDLAHKGNSTELWMNISSQVRKFRDHPALLGWYVCDDCMTQYLINQRKHKTPTIDTVYRALKSLDPYHPVIGAIESANVNTFTTANVFVPAPSLDVVMVENYQADLSSNAHPGGPASPGMDGSFAAWPLTWEPIVNCPGPWLVAGRTDISEEQKGLVIYSMSWLSVVLGDIPMQLHFRLSPGPLLPIYATIMDQVGRFGHVARSVQDFLSAPPSGLREPSLVPAFEGAGPCRQCAAVWRKEVSSRGDFCATFVVVNTESRRATAAFDLLGWEGRWPKAGASVLQRVDGGVGEHVQMNDGRLEVALAAFDTHVYMTADCNSELLV